MFKMIIQDPDMEWLPIDRIHIRAHQSSVGFSDSEFQAVAKNIDGNSTKIQLIADVHGTPLDFIISDGVIYDVKVAPDLIQRCNLNETQWLNVNRGYISEK